MRLSSQNEEWTALDLPMVEKAEKTPGQKGSSKWSAYCTNQVGQEEGSCVIFMQLPSVEFL